MSYYYEIHITLMPPRTEGDAIKLHELCNLYLFRPSKFTVSKDGELPKAFVSARIDHIVTAINHTSHFWNVLKKFGFTLVRYKIEAVVVDSNKEDCLHLFDYPEEA